jgi:hypothetical protein
VLIPKFSFKSSLISHPVGSFTVGADALVGPYDVQQRRFVNRPGFFISFSTRSGKTETTPGRFPACPAAFPESE